MIGFLQIATLVAIVLNGVDLSVGSLHLNSERVLLPFVIVALGVRFVHKAKLSFSRPAYYYAIFAFFIVVSAVFSGFSLHLNGFIVSIAPFFFFMLFMQTGLSRRTMSRAFEVALWYLSVGGIVVFVLWYKFDWLPTAIDRGRITLTMMEPNILGATLGAFMLIHLSFFRPILRHYVLHALSLVALVLTASKVPYAAYLVGVFFMLFRSGILRGAAPLVLTIGGCLVLLAAGVYFSGSLYNFYVQMLDRPDAINNRMYSLVIGWRRFLEHPVFGNGPLDFAHYNQDVLTWMGTDNVRNLWIWQIWVAILHDEGLFGFTPFVLFLIACWRRGQRMIRSGHKEFIGYLSAMLVTLVADQATTTHLSAIFGVIFGLMCSRPFPVIVVRRIVRGPLSQAHVGGGAYGANPHTAKGVVGGMARLGAVQAGKR